MSATFGMGSGMIVEHVRCNGRERQLSECTIRDSTDGQCSHSEDAGVRCCKLIMNLACSCLLMQARVQLIIIKFNGSRRESTMHAL